MRRMYSEQELTNVIKKVFEEELESGALDELVSDAVDAYLVENPVDITALEGQDIAPKDINATGDITAQSFLGDNAKPLYYHPIYIYDGTLGVVISCVIINNSPTAFTWATFKAWIEDFAIFNLCPCGGKFVTNDNTAIYVVQLAWNKSAQKLYGYGSKVADGATANALECTDTWNGIGAEGHSFAFNDSVNKLN